MGADVRTLIKRLEEEKEVSARRALLLCLGEFGEKDLPEGDRQALLPSLLAIYRYDPDPGIHGAVAWLLRQWQREKKIKAIDAAWAKDPQHREQRVAQIRQELAKNRGYAAPQWYINGQGQTLVVIRGPVEFLMGSPSAEANRWRGEELHHRRIRRTFAIATTPVTKEQLKRFRPSFSCPQIHLYPQPDCPIGVVNWYEAAAYCNWLSKEEGLPETEWCYEPNPQQQFAEGARLAPDYLKRTGYRLPTEAEWEYACRAGAVTSRYFGEAEELLGKYGWYIGNAQRRTWPVGSLKPNDLGLFDMHGNIWTWCQDRHQDYGSNSGVIWLEDNEERDAVINEKEDRVFRGGAFLNLPGDVRCAHRLSDMAASRNRHVGLRLARTLAL
jgi:formylglycine-generating enzyme required for sulfatase activity